MESKGEEICTIYKNSVTLPVDVTSILNSVYARMDRRFWGNHVIQICRHVVEF